MSETRAQLITQATELVSGLYYEVRDTEIYDQFCADVRKAARPFGWNVNSTLETASDQVLAALIVCYQSFAQKHMNAQWLVRHAKAMAVEPPSSPPAPKPRRMSLIEFGED